MKFLYLCNWDILSQNIFRVIFCLRIFFRDICLGYFVWDIFAGYFLQEPPLRSDIWELLHFQLGMISLVFFSYQLFQNRTKQVNSHRAGANFGLRVIMYANVSEYLPTTEAVGFRITVHDKWNVPFPDAFGHTAPV